MALVPPLGALAATVSAMPGAPEWVRQSPLPYRPLSGWSIAFTPGSGHGWIAGDGEVLQRSTDVGETWSEFMGGTGGTDSNGVFFFDDLHGWIVGNGGSRTTDGGATWQSMTDFPAGSYYEIDFPSVDIGFVTGNGGLWRTTDGGLHWEGLGFGYPQGAAYDVDFFDVSHGLVTFAGQDEANNGIYRTTDGGAHWTHVWSGLADKIAWLDADTVLVDTTFGPTLVRSTDGGATFETVTTAPTALASPFSPGGSVVMATATDYYGSGVFDPASSDGALWRSTDGGISWTKVFQGPGSWHFEAGTFLSPTKAFVVGNGNIIVRSDDGGESWSYVSNGCAQGWEQVEMIDGLHGVVCGMAGCVLVTQDGGETWIPMNPGQTLSHGETLINLSTVPPNFVIAAGLFGTIVKSLDAGQTWQAVTGAGGGTGDSWAVEFVTPEVGWLGTGRFIHKTVNGGQTWTEQFNGLVPTVENIYDLMFVDDQHGWAAGYPSKIVRTINGGQTWTPINAGTNAIWREIDFVDQNVGWVAGYHGFGGLGRVARTTNGGLTWTQQTIPPVNFIVTLDAVSADEAWIAGINGDVLHTTDGGSTWLAVTTGFEGPAGISAGWDGVHADANGGVWLAGYPYGDVIHLPAATSAPIGDINGDGIVDGADLGLLLGAFNTADRAADFNGDGVVDGADLGALLANWSS